MIFTLWKALTFKGESARYYGVLLIYLESLSIKSEWDFTHGKVLDLLALYNSI